MSVDEHGRRSYRFTIALYECSRSLSKSYTGLFDLWQPTAELDKILRF